MSVTALIDGQPYVFDTEDYTQVIGEGGEAIVMRWQPEPAARRTYGATQFAVKLFFQTGEDPEETAIRQAAAHLRQAKLRAIPEGLPSAVVTPLALATDPAGSIIGYVMPLLEDVVPLSKLMDRQFRQDWGITQTVAVEILGRLHAIVRELHEAGVVIGDFNDKNVLVSLETRDVHLIDFDSAQWGQWPSLVATSEFTDPTLLDESQNFRDGARYSEQSDWYSFAVMAYQLLTLNHPYRDGVHKPPPGTLRQYFPARVTSRVSVFDPDVHLDVSTHPPDSLPEKLEEQMRAIFTKDARVTPFPLELLTSLQWTNCPGCGREHGRSTCPTETCGAPGVSPILLPIVELTPDSILMTAVYQGGLRYVCHTNGAYRREDGTIVRERAYDARLTALVAGDRTVMAADDQFAILTDDPAKDRLHTTQTAYGRTTVATNSRSAYWLQDDQLVRDDAQHDHVAIGRITPHMTSVWVGEAFGIVMVRAGILTMLSVFDVERPDLGRPVVLPPEFGETIDAQCVISDDLAWLTITSRYGDDVQNRCYVLDATGTVRATAQTTLGSDTWLGRISPAALALGDKLLVPLPGHGIVRVGIQDEGLRQEGVYRGTDRLVQSSGETVTLTISAQSIVHVSQTAITPITPTD